ncbi:MAG: hypothetical protein LBT59_11555 [Clostridiales bacterium]|jgi:hypothetical protein|nr:hypothetical protein [Clostridiales bacterium]
MITIFAGHYGSGKTMLAVNKALELRKAHPGERIAVADLDIVNPYFRALDSKKLLDERGIETIASRFTNTNLEAPAMPPEGAAIFDTPGLHGIIDVGGDDRGAYALGRYALRIKEAKAEMILVCNMYRPLSRHPRQVLEIKREIEAASGSVFTALVNNSNLGKDTSAQDVLASMGWIEEVSKLCSLPVKAVCAKSALTPELGHIPGFLALEVTSLEKWRI